MNFDEAEEQDGIRFSWNYWPSSRLDATRNLVVPLGCMYSPMRKNPNTPIVYYEPVYCKGACHSVLNPMCTVDARAKLWVCPICYQRNQFPPHYADISETNLPAELHRQYSTIDYCLPTRSPPPPPIFLFVVDTCLPEAELQSLKDSILLSIALLPEKAQVGLITYGAMVQIHELGFSECPKSYVFRGNKEVTSQQIQSLLGLSSSSSRGNNQAPLSSSSSLPPHQQPPSASKVNGFLVPLSECELTLTSILEELQHDPRPLKSDRRPLRATGVALSSAISLLETTNAGTGARVMLFAGGPATDGPGIIVGDELKEPIRSFSDIIKDKAKYVSKSTKFYEALSKRAVTNGHAVDIFACSLDQVGLLEMREVVKKTGGLSVLADSFRDAMFRESYKHILSNAQNLGYNATIEVATSRELKVCGAIGQLASLNKSSPSVAETEIGLGNTSSWKACGLDPASTFSFFFEIVNQNTQQQQQQPPAIIQFTTHYQNALGQFILRVTTVSRPWADPAQGLGPLSYGFDQETSAVLMARLAVFKGDNMEDTADILRWLDRMLIRLVNKYATYQKDNPSSLDLPPNFSIYPQFMFHLRRSHFLQVFGNSPDEVAFFRTILNRETVSNSLVMIQPTLEAYSFAGPPAPVMLSAVSVTPDRILLLDTFFAVVVHTGDTLAQWRKAGYADDPAHANFKQLLDAPRGDAASILKDRFPYPRYIECDQNSSQARILTSTIDPAITHTTPAGPQDQVIFTDDVNMKVFTEHLKKLAVSSAQ
eukprot:TRINITY_DN4230_c0_g1_i1.p1 TRINITY_DN4230_c0_g1~~TRINITY_DN4230_c0_g1_i1.p1  ORF type:complete len:767 (+),score=244.33 TRINITY_DN4230_c0_g1_i1:143-2443(+)